MDKNKVPDNRLAYEKPRLRIIPLVAEEVLAINCKQAVGAPAKNAHGCGHNACRAALGS